MRELNTSCVNVPMYSPFEAASTETQMLIDNQETFFSEVSAKEWDYTYSGHGR